MIDTTITAGNIIEAGAFVGGAAVMLLRQNFIVDYMKKELTDLQLEIKQLAGIVTKMALADLRLGNLETEVRDLRHGRGFINPAVEGEWSRHGKIVIPTPDDPK